MRSRDPLNVPLNVLLVFCCLVLSLPYLAGLVSTALAAPDQDPLVGAGSANDTELPPAAALADNAANPTTSMVGANLMAYDGATWDRVTNGGGAEATALRVTLSNDSTGLVSVDDNAGSLTVDNAQLSVVGGGLEATSMRVTIASDSTGVISVDDNAGSLTIDNAQLSVVGAGAEATAMRVTLANDSTGLVSVDDNGGALTTDWAGVAPPIGAGLEATALRVTLATDSTGLVSVDDNAGSLTVDNAALAVVGGGAEATAMRVTIASDSTGVLSVDDNAASLTVDNAALSVVGSGVATAATLRVTQSTDDAAVVALQIMDDWDETNRAAVNPIAGQVGIAGGTGVDGATVPRVTLATNVALPAGANNIGDVDILTVPAPLSTTGGGLEATALRVTLASDSTGLVSVDDNAGSLTVDSAQLPAALGAGAEATALRVAIATDSTIALEAGAANIGDVDVLTVNGVAPAFGTGVVGATVQRVTVATDDVVSVDWNGTAPPIGGGVQATALRTTTSTDSPSVVAPDAAFPANTLAISARASTAKPTAMSGDGDASGIWTSRVGSVRMVSGEVAYVTSTTFGADLAAVGANTGNRLVVVTVRELSGAAARVMVRNGAADTGTLIAAISLAANGAETITFSGGINADSGVFLDWITGSVEITVGTEDHE